MDIKKIKITKANIADAFKQFVKDTCGFGDNSVYTFDLCSMYGVELDDSTIDRIRIAPNGEVQFVYNENENDYDTIDKFSYKSLKQFYNDIVDAWNEDMEYIEFENRGEGRDVIGSRRWILIICVHKIESIDNISKWIIFFITQIKNHLSTSIKYAVQNSDAI